MKTKEVSMLGAGFAVALTAAQAQFVPIPLTPESFNHDVVVEKEAIKPPAPATTATFDGGLANNSRTLYEVGLNQAALTTGVPAAGSSVTTFIGDVERVYTMPASYAVANALYLDPTATTGTLTLANPQALSSVSLLASSGGAAATLNYTVTFADDTTETGAASITVPDWFNGANVVVTANGRVDVGSRGFDTVNGNNPRIYAVDFALTETTKAVKSISFTHTSTGGRVGIFGASGQTTAGGTYAPLAVTGFNHDMIVEATPEQIRNGIGATTATMDSGPTNTGNSWYEQGYIESAPTTGLPAPGSLLTSAAAEDHQYRLPDTYAGPNAAFINAAVPTATLTPVTPVTASALSFLAAAGNGPIGLNYTLNYEGGATETGLLTIPDWFNQPNPVYTAAGRVNVVTAVPNNVGTTNPRIYSFDVPVSNTSGRIVSITLNHASGTGRAVVMAVSGTAGATLPLFSVQPVSFGRALGDGGTLDATVGGTAPLTYQWEKLVNGAWVPVQNSATISGATSEDLAFSNMTFAEFGDYRLTASNAAGSTSSRVVRVNVVSTRADLSIPGDIITLIGGNAPANEGVANAINDNTAKYLNFGADAVEPPTNLPPYEGPAGFQIEFIERAVVDGLRLYTANDGTERDPVGFTLLASNDPFAAPESFVTVATGSFNLPLERNANPNPSVALDPVTSANQEVQINNGAGYLIYRLLINSVRDNAAANSFQFAEIEFLGEFGAGRPSLNVARNADGTITITSSMPGTLQSTTSLSAPIQWGNDQPIDGSVTVPTTGAGVPAMQFFRVIQ